MNSFDDQLTDSARANDQGADSPIDGLVEITDLAHRCSHSMSCPAVFLRHDQAAYVVVGTTCDSRSKDLDGRVAPYESAVEIPAEILEAAVRDILRRKSSGSSI